MNRALLVPPDAALPPILRNRQYGVVLDTQIYELLSLVLQEHFAFFRALSPNDKTFYHQVTRVFIHAIQSFEIRLQDVDWSSLATNLPQLCTQHINDFYAAQDRLYQPSSDDIARFYCAANPHVAFDLTRNDERLPLVSPIYLSGLVDDILKQILPPEDYAADSERSVIREVVVYVVLGNLFSKLAQPWFLHQTLIKILGIGQEWMVATVRSRQQRPLESANTLLAGIATFHSCLTNTLLLLTSLFTLCASWFDTQPKGSADTKPDYRQTKPGNNATVAALSLAAAALQADKSPFRRQVFLLLNVLAAAFGAPVNLYVTNKTWDALGRPAALSQILRQTQTALFPNGKAAPRIPDPTPEEQQQLRVQAEAMLAKLPFEALATLAATGPQALRPLYQWALSKVPPNGSRSQSLAQGVLDPLSNCPCNARLVLALLDQAVAALFPEFLAPTP